MRVFVTGGSGFVGGHLIERLVRDGHEVLAMARSERSARAVKQLGATPVQAELGALRPEHLAGAEAVIHCAAYVEEHGTREQYWEANVEGTRNALEAARAAGVRRFVHVGTEAALFDGGDLISIDESHPYPARHRFLYPETKAEAERLVLAQSGAMAAISIRPRFVWGPRDTSVLPAVVRMAKEGSFAWIDGGQQRTSTCHVLNLVEALTLALERGQSGRAYFVTDGEDRTVRETLTGLTRAVGVRLPERSLPGWLLRPAAALIERLAGLLGKKPPMTRFAVAMMSATVTVRDDRARAELGYRPVISVAEGLRALATGPRPLEPTAHEARSAPGPG